MDVEKVFHMTGGVGNTSYAQNSSLQKAAADKAKYITLETVEELYIKTSPKSVGIADLGCSSGPNTLSIVKEIVEAIEGTGRKILLPSPEFRVYLNDLPTNDFNAIFKALPEFYKELRKGERQALHGGPSVYIAGYPGSFYGRLFPDKCLHFIYSSYSLHWLSRVPPALYDSQGRSINKGSIYITHCSPPEVSLAYHRQFQEDFSMFLRSRSEEVISGGRMVLILLGRRDKNHVDRGNAFFWELLSQSVKKLVGEVELEKLDSYDVHFYAPSKDEIEEEVKKEGSFALDRLEMLEMDKDARHYATYGTAVSMAVRAIQESMISRHFGEGILDSLFEHFGTLVDEEVAKEDIKGITLVIVLKKV